VWRFIFLAALSHLRQRTPPDQAPTPIGCLLFKERIALAFTAISLRLFCCERGAFYTPYFLRQALCKTNFSQTA
jgi:hypothetical protein